MTGFEITVIVLLSFLVIVQVIYIAVGLWIALTEDEMEGYDSNHYRSHKDVYTKNY